jgi:hypothetical protein
MKPEYLNEGHNTSGEGSGIAGAIIDPVIDATVDDPSLRECLKAAGYAKQVASTLQTQRCANVSRN